MKTYGLHPAQDVAIACNDLRHAVRKLYDEEQTPDRVGLGLAANVLDQVADALDRHWWTVRPTLEDE